MTARSRSRSQVIEGSIATWKGSGSLGPTQGSYTISELCNDTIGNWHLDNPFYLRRQTNIRFVMSGKTHATSGSHWDYGGSYFSTGPIPSHVPGIMTGEPSDTTSIEMAKARQNINRPITDLPVFIFELKDIPRLIKRSGDLLLSSVRNGANRDLKSFIREAPFQTADLAVSTEFGVKPLARDLRNMMTFVGTVNKKLNHLDRLYSRGGEDVGFNSTVWSNNGTVLDGDHYATGLYNETNRFRVARETTTKKWVSLKWKPLVRPPQTDAERWALAIRLAYGLDISYSTLWEAMPWSWLVDWFTNVSEYLVGSRNTVPVSASGSCVMLKKVTRYQLVSRVSGSGGSASTKPDGNIELNRWPGGASSGSSVKATLPFLDGRQLSILGALVVSLLGRN